MAKTSKQHDPETVVMQLRIPRFMHEMLVNEAEYNRRSVHAEILYRLERTLGLKGDKV